MGRREWGRERKGRPSQEGEPWHWGGGRIISERLFLGSLRPLGDGERGCTLRRSEGENSGTEHLRQVRCYLERVSMESVQISDEGEW